MKREGNFLVKFIRTKTLDNDLSKTYIMYEPKQKIILIRRLILGNNHTDIDVCKELRIFRGKLLTEELISFKDSTFEKIELILQWMRIYGVDIVERNNT